MDSYLDTAVGSTFEVVSGCFRALDEKYIDQATLDMLYAEGEVLAKSINAFRKTLRLD
ncbi:MAG: hypothetical protein HZB17_11935 [Chloroflexi bacterium]|nr:hypothetical protein [Chloroflexota bacterium]MBI5081992.1 hypothetical protein [Chloroflexota bacterium]MBI5347874.1 hypothetical protein [Chloroflexota bacterium]